MTYQTKTALFILCAASLTLTACGSRLHNNHAQTSGACGYVKSCTPATRYGSMGYNNGEYEYTSVYDSPAYETFYQAPYVQPPYVPAQQFTEITQYKCWNGQMVTNYDGCPSQTITQTIAQYRCWDEEIVTDANACKRPTLAPKAEYVPEPTLSTWTPPWRAEPDCPTGTIQGYGGSGCVQVTVLRK